MRADVPQWLECGNERKPLRSSPTALSTDQDRTSCGHSSLFVLVRIAWRGLREKPYANPGEPDKGLIAVFARRIVQGRRDRGVDPSNQVLWKSAPSVGRGGRSKTSEQIIDRSHRGMRQAKARMPDIDDAQGSAKQAEISCMALCFGRNRGDTRGKKGEPMLHETGDRHATLFRPGLRDGSQGLPIAA